MTPVTRRTKKLVDVIGARHWLPVRGQEDWLVALLVWSGVLVALAVGSLVSHGAGLAVSVGVGVAGITLGAIGKRRRPRSGHAVPTLVGADRVHPHRERAA